MILLPAMRIDYLKPRLLVLGTVLLGFFQPLAAKQPNVVFILTDDQRWDALSCMGNPHLKTPNIDRLAAEGALFRNHFCTTSLCSPSRASILGGLYAHSHGVVNNFTDYPRDLPTFPRQLQAAGYETAYIGAKEFAFCSLVLVPEGEKRNGGPQKEAAVWFGLPAESDGLISYGPVTVTTTSST